MFNSLISVQNIPISMQISTLSKMCREVLFILHSYEIYTSKEVYIILYYQFNVDIC